MLSRVARVRLSDRRERKVIQKGFELETILTPLALVNSTYGLHS